MLKVNDESKRFFAALEEDVPRVKMKTRDRVVYASLKATRGDNVIDGVHRLARAVDELQLRYGITGFLAECSVIQLAGRAAMRGIPGVSQEMIDSMPEHGPYAVFSFITLKDPSHVPDAQRWLAQQGLGGVEGEVGSLEI